MLMSRCKQKNKILNKLVSKKENGESYETKFFGSGENCNFFIPKSDLKLLLTEFIDHKEVLSASNCPTCCSASPI